MKISVGIPIFNQAEYLAQAIESVLVQTFKPHEIIICNDGSTDNSLEIAKSYESKGVKVIDQINKGLASARNTLIMNMTGEYFFPLDADDLMREDCLEIINQTIEKTHADIIAPSFQEFGIRNTKVILYSNPTLKEFVLNNMIPYCSAIKHSVLLEVGGYNPKMVWGWEDYALWFDLLSRNKTLITLPEMLIFYRTKNQSMITTANLHADELWKQIHKDFPSIFNK